MNGSFTLLVLPVIILILPIVLTIASKQGREIKQKLRRIFQISLILIFLLSFFNWESQTSGGRNAIRLAVDFKSLPLTIFLAINFIQIVILQTKSHKNDLAATVLNAANTFIFFAAAISISNVLGKSIVSLSIITVSLLVIINNVIGLILINKDPNLAGKNPWKPNKNSSRRK